MGVLTVAETSLIVCGVCVLVIILRVGGVLVHTVGSLVCVHVHVYYIIALSH